MLISQHVAWQLAIGAPWCGQARHLQLLTNCGARTRQQEQQQQLSRCRGVCFRGARAACRLHVACCSALDVCTAGSHESCTHMQCASARGRVWHGQGCSMICCSPRGSAPACPPACGRPACVVPSCVQGEHAPQQAGAAVPFNSCFTPSHSDMHGRQQVWCLEWMNACAMVHARRMLPHAMLAPVHAHASACAGPADGASLWGL